MREALERGDVLNGSLQLKWGSGKTMRSAGSLILAVLLAHSPTGAAAPPGMLKRAYLDRLQRVHVIAASDRDDMIDRSPAADLMLAPDHNAVVWKVLLKRGDTLSDEVRIYSQGRLRRLPCGPATSDFAFRDGGQRLVVRCAGLHFAGLQALYDTRSLRLIDSFQEAQVPLEQRPGWNIDAD